MRPAKRILLLAWDEQSASRLRFVLGLRYEVHAAETYRDMLQQLTQARKWDALLLEHPWSASGVPAGCLPPLVVFGRNLPLELVPSATCVTVEMGPQGGMARLLAAIRRMAAAKRGPKPKAKACPAGNDVKDSAAYGQGVHPGLGQGAAGVH